MESDRHQTGDHWAGERLGLSQPATSNIKSGGIRMIEWCGPESPVSLHNVRVFRTGSKPVRNYITFATSPTQTQIRVLEPAPY